MNYKIVKICGKMDIALTFTPNTLYIVTLTPFCLVLVRAHQNKHETLHYVVTASPQVLTTYTWNSRTSQYLTVRSM